MKKRQILKALSLLAAVCIAAGCNASTAAETTTTTAEITTTTAEETGQTDSNSDLPELEVDYVDDDGVVYYKNPTEWTYEMVYDGLLIEGKKIESPLTFEDFGEKYSLYKDTLTYFEKEKQVSLGITYGDNKVGGITFADCEGADDIENKEIVFLYFNCLSDDKQSDFPNVTVNKIGLYSTRDEVIETLGVPWREIYDDDKAYSITYKHKDKLSLVFILSDNEVIEFYITLND